LPERQSEPYTDILSEQLVFYAKSSGISKPIIPRAFRNRISILNRIANPVNAMGQRSRSEIDAFSADRSSGHQGVSARRTPEVRSAAW
jgi:hypothetical protein